MTGQTIASHGLAVPSFRSILIVNLASGDNVEWIRLEGGGSELFDIAVLPGVRWPAATGFLNNEIHKLYTFEA